MIVEYERSNFLRELGALPPALHTSGLGAIRFVCRSLHGLDRVSGRSEFVRRHVADCGSLPGSVSSMPRCPAEVSCCAIRVASGAASLPPRDLTARPGTPEVYRPTRAIVLRTRLRKVVQHVLRAIRRPYREEMMVVVLERPATTYGDETGIANLGQDHAIGGLPVVPATRRAISISGAQAHSRVGVITTATEYCAAKFAAVPKIAPMRSVYLTMY